MGGEWGEGGFERDSQTAPPSVALLRLLPGDPKGAAQCLQRSEGERDYDLKLKKKNLPK